MMCEKSEYTDVFVQVEQRYELAKPHLRALASTVTPVGQKGKQTHASRLEEGGFALEDWQWALAIVSSRALTFRGERFLVPICDMFNYSPHPVMLSDFIICVCNLSNAKSYTEKRDVKTYMTSPLSLSTSSTTVSSGHPLSCQRRILPGAPRPQQRARRLNRESRPRHQRRRPSVRRLRRQFQRFVFGPSWLRASCSKPFRLRVADALR